MSCQVDIKICLYGNFYLWQVGIGLDLKVGRNFAGKPTGPAGTGHLPLRESICHCQGPVRRVVQDASWPENEASDVRTMNRLTSKRFLKINES